MQPPPPESRPRPHLRPRGARRRTGQRASSEVCCSRASSRWSVSASRSRRTSPWWRSARRSRAHLLVDRGGVPGPGVAPRPPLVRRSARRDHVPVVPARCGSALVADALVGGARVPRRARPPVPAARRGQPHRHGWRARVLPVVGPGRASGPCSARSLILSATRVTWVGWNGVAVVCATAASAPTRCSTAELHGSRCRGRRGARGRCWATSQGGSERSRPGTDRETRFRGWTGLADSRRDQAADHYQLAHRAPLGALTLVTTGRFFCCPGQSRTQHDKPRTQSEKYHPSRGSHDEHGTASATSTSTTRRCATAPSRRA